MKTDVIINREALYALRELPSESVNCCVTSPPYYGLRDYGLDMQIGREDTPEQYIDRLNALLRRSENFNTEVTELTSNDISIRLLKGEVYKQGKLLELTASEYKLLCFFMENPDQVLSAEQILGKLWDCNENYIDNNSLTVYIRRLRTKIEDNPGEPKRIVTVRGMGYKWNTVD